MNPPTCGTKIRNTKILTNHICSKFRSLLHIQEYQSLLQNQTEVIPLYPSVSLHCFLYKKNGPLQTRSHTFFFHSERGLSVCSGSFFRDMWGVMLFLILFMIISYFEYEYVFLIIPKTTVKTLARLLELQRQLLFFCDMANKRKTAARILFSPMFGSMTQYWNHSMPNWYKDFLNEKMYPAVCTDEFEQEMNRLFDAIKYSQLSAPEAAAFQFKSWYLTKSSKAFIVL